MTCNECQHLQEGLKYLVCKHRKEIVQQPDLNFYCPYFKNKEVKE